MIPAANETMDPALIGIDWGSSNLRVALLNGQGVVMDRRESNAGVFTIKDGQFAAALRPLCADWLRTHRVPLLACGMVGSRQGVVEVPYLNCPADLDDLAGALVSVELPGFDAEGAAASLAIVPGLKTGSDATGWDVVRGEETQLVGASQSSSGQLFILPGTHSKWMLRSAAGGVESFQTYMTGELFELLCTHGSLARTMSAAPQWSSAAFEQGVSEAREGALENLLFRVRTAGLMGSLEPAALPDYLSGLLVGAEVKAGLQRVAMPRPGEPIAVIGSAKLTQRYALALASFGIEVREVPGDAVFLGLLKIAQRAGLLNRRESRT